MPHLKSRWLAGLVIGLLFSTAVFLTAQEFNWLSSFTNKVLDLGVSMRAEPESTSDVVVIGITPECLAKHFQEPYFPISHQLPPLTELIVKLDSAGVRAIAMDILFDSLQSVDSGLISAFANVCAGSGRVVLASALENIQPYYLPPESTLFLPVEPILNEIAGTGLINVPTSDDGRIRAYNSSKIFGQLKLGSLAAQAVETGFPGHLDSISDNSFYLDYAWYRHGIPLLTFSSVLGGGRLASLLKDKIIFVGLVAPEYGDSYPLPYDPAANKSTVVAGVEIHALAAQTMIARSGIKHGSDTLSIALIILLLAFGQGGVRRARPLMLILLLPVLLLIVISAGLLAVAQAGQLYAIGPALIAIAVGWVVLVAGNSSLVITTVRKQNRMKDAFIGQLEDKNKVIAAQKAEVEENHHQLQQMQLELIETARLAAVSSLYAGVAHEINNPLGAVQSNADMLTRVAGLVEKAGEDPLVAEALEKNRDLSRALSVIGDIGRTTLSATKDMSSVVQKLKTFARTDSAHRENIDINHTLESVLALTNNLRGNKIKVVTQFTPLPTLRCVAKKINQVFMNIITNATEAIDDLGSITVATEQKDNALCVTITDDGCGIEPDRLKTIFSPQFGTRDGQVVAGFGLAVAQNYVHDHDGTITLESQSREGTKVTVTLPLPDVAGKGA
ncbi:MAG: CHASE2 domain-containing protein [candidate division Zixibacteria bacterium]